MHSQTDLTIPVTQLPSLFTCKEFCMLTFFCYLFQGILPASLQNRLSSQGGRKSNPTTPTAVGPQASHQLYGSYNELSYGASVSKPQFDSPSTVSLTSTAPTNTRSEPARSSFPFDSGHFGNFQHAMPFGPFGPMSYYTPYGMGMATNSQGSSSFGENTTTKQAQSPVSPVPSSSHLLFNNTYSSMYTGPQPGGGAQAYQAAMASNAFSYPLMNNGNLEPLSSAKGDLLQDSASLGSSSMGSDISSHGSPDNES